MGRENWVLFIWQESTLTQVMQYVGKYQNMNIWRLPMQNRTNSRILHFSTPQWNMEVSS